MGFQLPGQPIPRTQCIERRRNPPLIVVDKVTEARRVDDGQLEPNAVLLDIYIVSLILEHLENIGRYLPDRTLTDLR